MLGEYGLRNKRELRRHETTLSKTRGIARSLLGATEAERSRIEKEYMASLAKLGFLSSESTVDDILDLNVKDLMERRLQTMVYRSGLSKTIHQARQLVSHGHISVAGRIITVPGYIVRRDEDAKISFHEQSPLNNPQHPARGAPTGKQIGREEAGEHESPRRLQPEPPSVPKEIAEEVEAEKPLEASVVETEGEEGEQNS